MDTPAAWIVVTEDNVRLQRRKMNLVIGPTKGRCVCVCVSRQRAPLNYPNAGGGECLQRLMKPDKFQYKKCSPTSSNGIFAALRSVHCSEINLVQKCIVQYSGFQSFRCTKRRKKSIQVTPRWRKGDPTKAQEEKFRPLVCPSKCCISFVKMEPLARSQTFFAHTHK